jgi:hypothetical protein
MTPGRDGQEPVCARLSPPGHAHTDPRAVPDPAHPARPPPATARWGPALGAMRPRAHRGRTRTGP